MKISKFKIIIILAFLLSISFVNLYNLGYINQNRLNSVSTQKIYTSSTEDHTVTNSNPTFSDSGLPWYSSIDGDSSDGLATIGIDQANVKLIGDSRSTQVLLDSDTYTNWKAFLRSDLEIVPQRASVPYYGVDANGCWASHWWNEGEGGGQPKNTPRMHWRTNVSLPVDMSDYIITSVNFNAVINASVDRNVDTPGDVYAKFSPNVLRDQFQKWDHAQFYVEISTLDIDELSTYRIAFNQTRLLGNESLSLYSIEGNIGVFENKAIIDAITNVLAVDPGHDNFTIILGIYLYCEDNQSGTDLDFWNDIRFKTINLTFNYVKRIDKATTISWNQDLDEINGTSKAINVQIINAILNFRYKIDTNWTEASQNSQIRIYINDRKYDQTISLIDYVYTPDFQEAKIGGYNIASKILPYENFTLSIQVYLAEDFGLENNITVSFTDAYLEITYRETFADTGIPEPWIFAGLFSIATIAAVLATAYLIAYQMYLKYPIPVRKVRKYRKTLENENYPNVIITERRTSFNRIFQKEMGKTARFLTGVPLDGKIAREKLLGK